jgi:predicted transcriptional regulator
MSAESDMKKLTGILKLFGALIAIVVSCWGGVKLAVTLPERLDGQDKKIEKNTQTIERIQTSAQDLEKILIRIDERGKGQDRLLQELKEEVRKR